MYTTISSYHVLRCRIFYIMFCCIIKFHDLPEGHSRYTTLSSHYVLRRKLFYITFCCIIKCHDDDDDNDDNIDDDGHDNDVDGDDDNDDDDNNDDWHTLRRSAALRSRARCHRCFYFS